MRIRRLLLVPIAALALVSCHECGGGHTHNYDDIDQCRFDPECNGGMGASCHSDGDCDSDFCCDEDKNCGGGMCTAPCHDDHDCPSGMRCEHDVCFFSCDDDDDCADGMSCEHGGTVCEWP